MHQDLRKRKIESGKGATQASLEKGFSIIELMVAAGLFAVIVTLSVGAIVTVIAVNQKARAFETIMTNLDFALDSIVRDLRMGTNYDCGIITYTDCPVWSTGSSIITFTSYNNLVSRYSLSSGRIVKQVGSGSPVPLTSDDIQIEKLLFYVSGTQDGLDPNDEEQPKVTIVLQGYAGVNPRVRTRFDMQTTVSQRVFDLQN